jgi:uncharacterized membrane protein
MNIAGKIARTLNIGGMAIAVCFIIAIIAGLLKMPQAAILAAVGIIVTAATPVAGVITAAILLYKNGETKYLAYSLILLVMMIFAGLWRLLS